MIISKIQLRRTAGAQGTLAKVLLDGSTGDRGHSLIWSLFSSTGDESRSFLYRQIDAGSYIAVSHRPPEDAHHLWHIDTKEYGPELQEGQHLRFVLRANPAMSTREAGKIVSEGSHAPRGARVDAIMRAKAKLSPAERKEFQGGAEVALDWLAARGPALGAEFDRHRCSATGYQQIIFRKTGLRKPITFSEIDYEGILTVTEPAKLTTALFNGIGKAKSYGCGLMLVRPA